jgi:hypothetical protein
MSLGTLGFAFLAGVLTVLSPCVLPLLPAPVLMCYGAKSHGDEPNERKPLTLTDALNRTWTFKAGEPTLLCKSIDRKGSEAKGRAIGLVGYQFADAKGPDGLPASVRLPTANAFGAHILQVGQPELVFLPSLVE